MGWPKTRVEYKQMGDGDDQQSWRRKTPEERARDVHLLFFSRLNPMQPLMIGAIGAVVGTGIGVAGELKANSEVGLLSLLLGIAFGILTGSLAFILQAAGWLSQAKRVRMGICNRCFKMTLDGTLDHCVCGGGFEDADGWTLNRCRKCGYDLRASADRCPECGVWIGGPKSD